MKMLHCHRITCQQVHLLTNVLSRGPPWLVCHHNAPRSNKRTCSKTTTAYTWTLCRVCAPFPEVGKGLPKAHMGPTCSLASTAPPSRVGALESYCCSNATAAGPTLAFFSLFAGFEGLFSLPGGGLYTPVGLHPLWLCSLYKAIVRPYSPLSGQWG